MSQHRINCNILKLIYFPLSILCTGIFFSRTVQLKRKKTDSRRGSVFHETITPFYSDRVYIPWKFVTIELYTPWKSVTRELYTPWRSVTVELYTSWRYIMEVCNCRVIYTLEVCNHGAVICSDIMYLYILSVVILQVMMAGPDLCRLPVCFQQTYTS